jgi:hypothetical protein
VSAEGGTTVELQSAVVNHDIVNRMGISLTNVSDDNSFAGEIISFAIIESAFTPISGTTAIKYFVPVDTSANFVFFPKISDAFARSLDKEFAHEAKHTRSFINKVTFGLVNGRARRPW